MGDSSGSLFKSMKAKLGMNSMKQKVHHHREGSNTSQGGVPDVVDETHRHSGPREGHRRDPRKYSLEKPSKSREIMMAAYKGMRSSQDLLLRSPGLNPLAWHYSRCEMICFLCTYRTVVTAEKRL